MKNFRLLSTSGTLKTRHITGLVVFFLFFLPVLVEARIYIDINSPSLQKIKIAMPDFKDFSSSKEHPELAAEFPKILGNDLDLCGYFTAIDKDAFLDEDGPKLTAKNINFKNWTAIGAEFLLKGGYTCYGRNVEVEVRLYDVLYGNQIMGKVFLGKIDDRGLVHRISNAIINAMTGRDGMFLSKIIFVGTATGSKEIYQCDYDGYNAKQITSDNSIAMYPRYSPKGDRIIYTSYKEDDSPMVYMQSLSSSRAVKVSGRDGLNYCPRWAPDNENVVLALSFKGNSDIYNIDTSGKILKQLTTHWADDLSPTFSPDGKSMAFVSNRAGNPNIFIKDLKNGSEKRLTYENQFVNGGKYNTSPDWSSQDRIVFTQMYDSAMDIFAIDPNGKNLKQLTQDSGKNEDPCWSPDGRYIVFSSNRDGGFHLYIMNANGQNQRRITFLKGEQTAPSWSPF